MKAAVPSGQAPPGPARSSILEDHAAARRRGGGIYFVGTLVSQAAALLRYVALARLLGPEQVGLAATLVVTGTFFDMVSDTGADRFLIQDRYGDAVSVQKLVQLVLVGRGVFSAAGLALFAIPLANFYRAPELAKAFVILALSPLITGFVHLDVRRAQRAHDFRSQGICMIVGESVGLAATVAAAWLTGQFTAILYGLIARSAVMVLMSHMLAQRPYRLGWDREHAPRLSRFALPLMLNGVVLFIASQSDRVIVGSQLGPKALGLYSAILLLIYYPAVLLATYIHSVYIPLIAAQRDSDTDRNRISDGQGGLTLILAIAMAVGFAVVTPTLAPMLFGDRFRQAALLVGLIGILQMTRFMFGWPTTSALAMGRGGTVLTSNLAHLFALAGALIGLRMTGALEGVVTGLILGEFIALVIALVLLNRDMRRPPLQTFDRVAEFILACGVIVGWNLALSSRLWQSEAAMAAVTAALSLWFYRRESGLIAEMLAGTRGLASALLFRVKGR
jgi:O-antigen/teichoic acid export membrane protein